MWCPGDDDGGGGVLILGERHEAKVVGDVSGGGGCF